MTSPRFLVFAAVLGFGVPTVDAASIYLDGGLSLGDNSGGIIDTFIIPPGISSATVSNPYQAGGAVNGFTDAPDDAYAYLFSAFGTPGVLHLSAEASNSDDDVLDPAPSLGHVEGSVGLSFGFTDSIAVGGMADGTLQLSYLWSGNEACEGNLATCTTAASFQPVGNGVTLTGVSSQVSGNVLFKTTADVPYSDGYVGLQATFSAFAECDSSYGGDCLALSNFSETAMFGDAVVLDSSGNIVPGATVTSQSGYDYTQALVEGTPEPGTLGMVVVGLAALAFWQRKRTC